MKLLFPAALLLSAMTLGAGGQPSAAAVVRSEFIFEAAPFASAHASTIAHTPDGLVAAWFGGTREGAPDVGIWSARQQEGRWTAPIEVATGVQPDGTRHPCWNPVLYETRPGVLTLFYKVGPRPTTWWGMARTSRDNGRTWSDARRLPDGVLGPVKNKPVRLEDGTIISGSSTETPDAQNAWRIHFERSTDNGETWTIVRPAAAPAGPEIGAIQPSILIHKDGRLQAVGRSRSERVFETWSSDKGVTWSAVTLTSLPNPSAGTDALTLRDGRHLIVYNHTTRGRTPLNVAVSRDGKVWEPALVLESEPGEYSYPAVIQAPDGLVHVTYTWKRQRIKHVVIDPAKLPVAGPADEIVGTWRGTSACVDRQAAPACTDEVVIYDIVAKPGQPDAVTVTADKVVDGKRVPMGPLGFTHEATSRNWTSELETPRTHALWRLSVSGTTLRGTLTLLPSRAVVRRVDLQRDK